MIEAITGLVIFLIAQLSKRFSIPTTYIVVALVLIAGWIYSAIEYNNPELLVKLTAFITTSFATSQWLRLLYNKLQNNEQGKNL